MELGFSKGKIIFNKELSGLDRLVLKFVKILDSQKVDYVVISGYVAILFGRSRNTEDVDLFIEEMPYGKFLKMWNALYGNGFECINEQRPENAYYEYLKNQTAIRFPENGEFLPNFELKFPKTRYNNYSLSHKIEVILNSERLNISELELQIAFKLSLGSDKDFEDARHLYKVFKGHLDKGLLERQIRELRVEKEAGEILWKKA